MKKIMKKMQQSQIKNCPTAEEDINNFCETNTNAKDKYNECVKNFTNQTVYCLENDPTGYHNKKPFTYCKTQCQPLIRNNGLKYLTGFPCSES